MINKLLALYQLLSNSLVLLISNQIDKEKLLKQYFKKSIVYFDVGANIGTNVKFIKKIFGKNAIIHCFEPNHECLKILNNIPRIKINDFAIDKDNKSKNYYEHPISSWSSLKKIEGYKRKIKIKCSTLDKYIEKQKIKKIDYLKIDTEGNDFNVLLSAKNFISKGKIKIIEAEIIFSNKNKYTNENFDNIYSFLKKNNYDLIGINDQKIINNKILCFNAIFNFKK